MYKCIVIDQGVQVGLNDIYSFIYSDKAYFITEVPGNKVTITRRVNTQFHEVLNSDISNFVDAGGAPIATNVAEFRAFMSQQALKVKAGEGISVTADNTVSVKAGGPSNLGGYRVGTGLNVDGEGRLSATASSEVTKVLATEAEMLALATESLRPYRVIRMDSKRLYYLNAGASPAVLSNWFVGPSIEAGSLSFNTRTGQIVSEFGDYELSLVPTTDETTGVVYTLVVEDGELYLENTSDKSRVKVGDNQILNELVVNFNQLNDIVTQGDTSIVNKVNELIEKSNQYDLVINGAESGLTKRIDNIEVEVSATKQRLTDIEGGYVNKDQVGVAGGLATLDATGKVPASQLPEKQVGVNSFKGRTGSVNPATGDYTAEQITTSTTAQFASQSEKDIWNAKAEKSYVDEVDTQNRTYTDGKIADSKADDKTYVDNTFVRKDAANIANGYVKLDNTAMIPYDLLPAMNTARKVSVANAAARLALDEYDDLTIAYQQDDGSVWAINAYDDPSVAANWSTLGSTEAMGVVSFNGRTGNVAPQPGDYTTVDIMESVGRTFVSGSDRTKWDSKVDTSQLNTELVKYIPKTQLGTSGGVATLGSDGKVLASQLPPASTVSESRLKAVEELANLADQKGDIAADNSVLLDQRLQAVEARSSGGTPRKYANVKGSRSVTTFFKNNSDNEMQVYISGVRSAVVTRQITVNIREIGTTVNFTIQSPYVAVGSDKDLQVSFAVPKGYEYQLQNTGGFTTMSVINTWYELV